VIEARSRRSAINASSDGEDPVPDPLRAQRVDDVADLGDAVSPPSSPTWIVTPRTG
jgi:hypothetical protein